jgi:hypothetical protein
VLLLYRVLRQRLSGLSRSALTRRITHHRSPAYGCFTGEGSHATSTGRQLGETGGLMCAGGVWWGEGPHCGMSIDIIIRDPAASANCHIVHLPQRASDRWLHRCCQARVGSAGADRRHADRPASRQRSRAGDGKVGPRASSG